MKRTRLALLLLAAYPILTIAPKAMADDPAPPQKTEAVDKAAAKKQAQKEKKMAQIDRLVKNQVKQTMKKLKLTEEQKTQLDKLFYNYFIARLPKANAFILAKEPPAKQEARKALRQLDSKLKKALSETLDEKQLLALDKLFKSNMEALKPRPAGGGDGGGWGDGGGGGGGGGGE